MCVQLVGPAARRKAEAFREKKRFKAYMKQLETEEAGDELLAKFESLEDVKKANEKLKRALCQ